MLETKIVVVGAGVAGLTSALLLSKNKHYSITVAAKYMPGDYDIEYASPWAGANYMPVSSKDTPASVWERDTWPALQELAQHHPDAGIHFQRCEVLNREKDVPSLSDPFGSLHTNNPWWREVFPDFKEVPQQELKPGMSHAMTFTSVCINTAIYLPWLISQCLSNGVVFKRGIFRHINEAVDAHASSQKADIVVNCTGLSALKLGGVEDKNLLPARGQIVVVRNEAGSMYAVSGSDDADEVTYIMQRAAGGGTILGGSYQKGNWESQPDPNLAVRIMKRCVELCPKLTGGKGIEHLSVIRHGVGLRPLRNGGARLEKEKIGTFWAVHNYGHGGWGYQTSYGCSQAVVKLVDEIVLQKTGE